MVTGHADTQPRVANDSPEHRAQNRRVDITFVNGKERHGGWGAETDASAAKPDAPTAAAAGEPSPARTDVGDVLSPPP
jgi:hypothetical protein